MRTHEHEPTVGTGGSRRLCRLRRASAPHDPGRCLRGTDGRDRLGHGLNVAQPELAVEFDASQSEALWFINLYTISLAALLLPLGALGDRWGHKPMLLMGLTIFDLSNVAAGLAESSEIMLASRFASGVGAAMIMPVTLAVITSTFPEEERAKGIGVWTGVAGGGGILGMYLSPLLVDVANWRWPFVLPVGLVLIAVAMVLRSVPNSREHTAHRFDSVGSITSVIAVSAEQALPPRHPRVRRLPAAPP
jgi:MFS family permease